MPGPANDDYQPPSTGAPVLSVTYNSDRTLAAVICSDSSLQIWTPSTRVPGLMKYDAPVQHAALKLSEVGTTTATCCCWAPGEQGRCLAIGTPAGVVHLLQQQPSQQGTGTWHWTGRIQAGLGPVGAVAFGPGHLRSLVLAVAVQPQPPRRMPDGSSSSSGGGGGGGGAGSVVHLYESPAEWVKPLTQWTHLSKVQVSRAAACTALSWCPQQPGLPPLLLAGADSGAAVWRYHQQSMTWEEVCVLPSPPGVSTTPALALDWCPPLGRPAWVNLVAVSYGTTVVLWRLENAGAGGGSSGGSTAAAASSELVLKGSLEASLEHQASVWQVSFDQFGSAVACGLTGQPGVWVWKQDTLGRWALVVRVAGVDRGVLPLPQRQDAEMAAADLDLD